MKVRDRTIKSKDDYAGRPVEALNEACPCRPCYHPHDCGHTDWDGKWVVVMRCITRDNKGCPEEREPEHVYKGQGKVCRRCHQRRP